MHCTKYARVSRSWTGVWQDGRHEVRAFAVAVLDLRDARQEEAVPVLDRRAVEARLRVAGPAPLAEVLHLEAAAGQPAAHRLELARVAAAEAAAVQEGGVRHVERVLERGVQRALEVEGALHRDVARVVEAGDVEGLRRRLGVGAAPHPHEALRLARGEGGHPARGRIRRLADEPRDGRAARRGRRTASRGSRTGARPTPARAPARAESCGAGSGRARRPAGRPRRGTARAAVPSTVTARGFSPSSLARHATYQPSSTRATERRPLVSPGASSSALTASRAPRLASPARRLSRAPPAARA